MSSANIKTEKDDIDILQEDADDEGPEEFEDFFKDLEDSLTKQGETGSNSSTDSQSNRNLAGDSRRKEHESRYRRSKKRGRSSRSPCHDQYEKTRRVRSGSRTRDPIYDENCTRRKSRSRENEHDNDQQMSVPPPIIIKTETERADVSIVPLPVSIKMETEQDEQSNESNETYPELPVNNIGSDKSLFPQPSTSMAEMGHDGSVTIPGFKKILLIKQETKAKLPRMVKALQACKCVIAKIKDAEMAAITSRFMYTPTTACIIDDDESTAYYRSPLKKLSNIEYKFNSKNTNISTNQWNMYQLSPTTSNVARLLGLSAMKLLEELPLKSVKNRNERKNSRRKLRTNPSFYTETGTQTEGNGCKECVVRRLKQRKEVGVQCRTNSASIGSQTDENDELPIMRIIPMLSDNELLALNDFAELIREGPIRGVTNVYKLRERLISIYNVAHQSFPEPLRSSTDINFSPTYDRLPLYERHPSPSHTREYYRSSFEPNPAESFRAPHRPSSTYDLLPRRHPSPPQFLQPREHYRSHFTKNPAARRY